MIVGSARWSLIRTAFVVALFMVAGCQDVSLRERPVVIRDQTSQPTTALAQQPNRVHEVKGAPTTITPVQFIGLSFLSNDKLIGMVAPRIKSLLDDKAFEQALEHRFDEGLIALQRERPDLRLTQDYQQHSGDVYMLSFVIVAENVEFFDVGSTEMVNYDLQVLVFVGNINPNARRQRVVTSYPIRIRLTDTKTPDHSPAKELDVYRKLLLAPPENLDIVKLWAARAAGIKLREQEIWLSVPQLKIAESVAKYLALTDADRLRLQLHSTTTLEAQLSEKLNIPVVPTGPSEATETMELKLAKRNDATCPRTQMDGISTCTFTQPQATRRVEVELLEVDSRKNQGRSSHGNVLITKGVRASLFDVKVLRTVGREPTEVIAQTILRRVSQYEYLGERTFEEKDALAREIIIFHNEFGSWLGAPTAEWAKHSISSRERRAHDGVVRNFVRFVEQIKKPCC